MARKRKRSSPSTPARAAAPTTSKKEAKKQNKKLSPSSPANASPRESRHSRSLFQKGRLKIHVAVPPSATATGGAGTGAGASSIDVFLHTHLTSNLLLKHTENGTIIAFSNFKSLSGRGRILDECPLAWSWFEGDVVLFNPQIGQRISMYIPNLAVFGAEANRARPCFQWGV